GRGGQWPGGPGRLAARGSMVQRQLDREFGAEVPAGASGLNATRVHFHQHVRDRETQSEAAETVGTALGRMFTLRERLEDVRLFHGRHADPGVHNLDADETARLIGSRL